MRIDGRRPGGGAAGRVDATTARRLAATYAGHVVALYESFRPNDYRVRQAVDVALRFAVGSATAAELAEANRLAEEAAREAGSAPYAMQDCARAAAAAASPDPAEALAGAARYGVSAAGWAAEDGWRRQPFAKETAEARERAWQAARRREMCELASARLREHERALEASRL